MKNLLPFGRDGDPVLVLVDTMSRLDLELEVGEAGDLGELATVFYQGLFDNLFAILLPDGDTGGVVVAKVVA